MSIYMVSVHTSSA